MFTCSGRGRPRGAPNLDVVPALGLPRALSNWGEAADMSCFAVRRRIGVEVTGQREAARPAVAPEREVAAHLAVAEALVSWDGLERGAERLLASLAEALDFRAGVLWVPSG